MIDQKSRLSRYQPPTYSSTLSRTPSDHSISEKPKLGDDESDLDTLVNESRAKRSIPFETIFQWALKILGVASAIVFGVWAPVSYRLQASGNESSDEAQARVREKLEGLVRRVEGVESAVRSEGMLRAVEVCNQDHWKTLKACRSLTSSLDLASIIGDLVTGPTHTTHEASSRKSVYTTTPTVESVPMSGNDLQSAIYSTSQRSSGLTQTGDIPRHEHTRAPSSEDVKQAVDTWSDVGSVLGILAGFLVVCLCGWVIGKKMRRKDDQAKSGDRAPLAKEPSLPSYTMLN